MHVYRGDRSAGAPNSNRPYGPRLTILKSSYAGATRTDKNAQRTTGNRAQASNVEAAKAISDVIRTSLGPRAMLKMVIDRMGGIVVTSDGNAVLRELDVAHPAAKSMLEVCRTQDEEVGDGTTSVVVLAGEFLTAAIPLLERKIHPIVIISGFRQALECGLKALGTIAVPVDIENEEKVKQFVKVSLGTKILGQHTDHIVDLAVQAVKNVTIKRQDAVNATRTESDIKRYAKVEKIPGGDISDSFIVNGVMFNKDIMHPGMRKRIDNPRVILLDCPLEYKKGESQTNLEVVKEGDFAKFLKLEEEQIAEMCEHLKSLKPDIVVTEKGCSDLAQHYLQKAGITCLRRLKKSDNNRLARCTGATIANRVEDVKESDVGKACGLFHLERIDSEYFCFFDECKDPKACTIVLRGASKDIINEVERNLHDAMSVTRNLFLDPRLVPGGGAGEMEAAGRIADLARTIEGVAKFPILSIARALEVIPRTLLQNCGADPIQLMTDLRAKHAVPGGETFGVDAGRAVASNEKRLVDMKEAGIWEPLVVKTQTLKSAIEAACMLLRVDDIVAGVGGKDKGNGREASGELDDQDPVAQD